MAARAVVIVTGGGPPAADVVARLPAGARVVAADSGVDTALSLGLGIDVVVGDLDSVSAAGLAAAEAAGARIERHPVAKEATDLALALAEAARLLDGQAVEGRQGEGRAELVVVGGAGGRLDHLLAGVLALTDAAWAPYGVLAHLGPATVQVVHGPGTRLLAGEVGDVVTLVAVGGPAAGVRTAGLRFPLHGEPLAPSTTRGVSNVIESIPASVALDAGVLLAVLPGIDTDGGTL